MSPRPDQIGLTYAVAIVLPVVATFFLVFGFLEDSGYIPRVAIFSDRIFRMMGLTYAIAIVLPVVATFFLVFGFLEDSGYIPRLAIFSDRIFRTMGLNGKAVLPMVGLGCDTMATMTTRTLGTPKERLIAVMLLALGIPCSAQLATILGILGGVSFFALLTLFGVVLLQMFLVGFLAARALPGERSEFIMELPPLRMPQLGNILHKTLLRVRWYLGEAVPLFLIPSWRYKLFPGHRPSARAGG